jgi:hypothetical protein
LPAGLSVVTVSDRNEKSWDKQLAVDLDFGDVRFADRFALSGRAVGEDLGEFGA